MKISEVYPKPAKRTVTPPPQQFPQDKPDGKLCRQGINVYLNHSYGPGWVCKRCSWRPDLSQLFKR